MDFNSKHLVLQKHLSSRCLQKNKTKNERINMLPSERGTLSSAEFDSFWFCKLLRQRLNLRQWPTWYTIIVFYNTFIIILYMFRALYCSSSGGWIVLMQHLVSSLSVSGRPVHRLRGNCRAVLSQLWTRQPLTGSDDTRCYINTIQPPDDEHVMLETCRGL